MTRLELTDLLSVGAEWRDIKGIAYRRGEQIVANPLRPLIHDLDLLPYPERNDIHPTMILAPKDGATVPRAAPGRRP